MMHDMYPGGRMERGAPVFGSDGTLFATDPASGDHARTRRRLKNRLIFTGFPFMVTATILHPEGGKNA